MVKILYLDLITYWDTRWGQQHMIYFLRYPTIHFDLHMIYFFKVLHNLSLQYWRKKSEFTLGGLALENWVYSLEYIKTVIGIRNHLCKWTINDFLVTIVDEYK